MVQHTTVPTAFGNDEVTLGFGYTSGNVGLHSDSPLTTYASRVRVERGDDGIATVWFKSGNETHGFVYMDDHVAQRIGVLAEHHGATVEGI